MSRTIAAGTDNTDGARRPARRRGRRKMRFTSPTSSQGVTERFFTLDEIPGVLWMPEGASGARPLILLGHGGRQHKTAPNTVSRARRYAAEGLAAVPIDAPYTATGPMTRSSAGSPPGYGP